MQIDKPYRKLPTKAAGVVSPKLTASDCDNISLLLNKVMNFHFLPQHIMYTMWAPLTGCVAAPKNFKKPLLVGGWFNFLPACMHACCFLL